MRTYRNLNTGKMPEKIMATATYHYMLVNKISSGRIKKNIARSGAGIVDKYFGLWLDNKARRDPQSFHHLYEWNKVGQKDARLFECNISNNENPVISFYFKESSEPNNDGHIFYNKASVMENGDPVVIEPVDSEVLAFEIDGEVAFTPNEVYIDNPGGDAVKGSFVKAFNEFMSGEAESSLQAMGFSTSILSTIKLESDRTLSRMSGVTVINPSQSSTVSAEAVARAVEVINNEL